jgi:hypothetical protein
VSEVYRRFGGSYCHITRAVPPSVIVVPSPTLKMEAVRSTEASAELGLRVIPRDSTQLCSSACACILTDIESWCRNVSQYSASIIRLSTFPMTALVRFQVGPLALGKAVFIPPTAPLWNR